MNKILEFETYLSISQTKFGIYLFDTKNKNNLYEKEIIFEKTTFINYSHLKQFLDDNVFRIEKLVGKFIENIFIIVEDENITENFHLTEFNPRSFQSTLKAFNGSKCTGQRYVQTDCSTRKITSKAYQENYKMDNSTHACTHKDTILYIYTGF